MSNTKANEEFPKFLVSCDGNSRFVSFREAARLQSSLFDPWDAGSDVLEADFTVRKATDAELGAITELADRMDAAK